MPRAVMFDRYGGLDVLELREVERPTPDAGEVLVRVKAAGINPGEASIREGRLHERFPASFPSGEGSDLAGVVEELGEGVERFAIGDEVIGFTHRRASHAELVLVEAGNLIPRPAKVSWEAAGALFVAGSTAYATIHAVAPQRGETLIVSGAAGGVGSLAVQLGVHAGAKVIGIASEGNHEWLAQHGAIGVAYGDGLLERLREAAGGEVDAFIDTYGSGYVGIALELGVPRERIDTIADFDAVEREGVKGDGSAAAANAGVLAELAALIEDGELEVPIAKTFPLERVRDAFAELERRHTRGKIVLVP